MANFRYVFYYVNYSFVNFLIFYRLPSAMTIMLVFLMNLLLFIKLIIVFMLLSALVMLKSKSWLEKVVSFFRWILWKNLLFSQKLFSKEMVLFLFNVASFHQWNLILLWSNFILLQITVNVIFQFVIKLLHVLISIMLAAR